MRSRNILLSVIIIALASCASHEQKICEKVLKDSLKTPASYHFVSFELEEEETLADEINDRLDWLKADTFGYSFDRQAMEAFLTSTLEGSSTVDAVTARTYCLEYDAQNTFGALVRGKFYARFNADRELVAYKTEGGSWTLVGQYFSIPGYYELLGH